MSLFDHQMRRRTKEFLFYRHAYLAPHHTSWYKHRPEELRSIKRRYRKILRRARSKAGSVFSDYEAIYVAYDLGKYRNVCKSWERWKSKQRSMRP